MLAKVALSLLSASLIGAQQAISDEDSEGCTGLLQIDMGISHRMRPKTQWEEPLSPEEIVEFEKDMRKPIKLWLLENPDLNSDYFVKFGIPRGYTELVFWNGVHNLTDYVESGMTGANMWKTLPGYLGEGKGPSKTWTIEGSTITSHHLDASSYFPDDAYCWTFGWLKGQGLDGSLMSDKLAWDALNAQECNKIGEALAVDFPEENHTVYRHVMWNRVWPNKLECNVVGASCTPRMTKNNLREHVYRKCLFGFAPTEMAYCYSRASLVDGTDIVRH
eukprot:TRINITY_DN22017_c0_g1_i3.p1 TRINITY_DN22017_c0_g1~~TRINITY_DN22017_c0_g1_i3.p1  ORF type:complete len:276 (-),score=47.39 TRINITY_DN22017_c0_g1_i3:171-998(-)